MEERLHKIHPGKTKFGRSTVLVDCPFCSTQVEAYIWSMAGSGKKCPKCGAIHKWSRGMSIRKDASQQGMVRTLRKHWRAAGKRILKSKSDVLA